MLHKQQQVRVVFTMPCPQSSMVFHAATPAHSLQLADSLSRMASDYESLFGEGKDSQNQSDAGDRSLKRRPNIGERIKHKLESTNNKSSNMGGQVWHLESRLSQQGQNYEMSSSNYSVNEEPNYIPEFNNEEEIMVHPFQCEEEGSSSYLNTDKYCNVAYEEEHSSPYNEVTAKTESLSGGNPSPIDQLTDEQELLIPASRIELLNFNESQSEDHEEVPTITVKQPEPVEEDHEFASSIKVVSSRVVDRPYFGGVYGIESRCVPCDQDQLNCLPGFSYAMDQLEQLKQSVAQLEISTSNLAALKTDFSFLPSSINKPQDPQMDESFILQLENNLKEVLEKNQQESLLIGDSREEEAEEEQENGEAWRYHTPGNSTKEAGRSHNILTEWQLRQNTKQIQKISRPLTLKDEPMDKDPADERCKQNKWTANCPSNQ